MIDRHTYGSLCCLGYDMISILRNSAFRLKWQGLQAAGYVSVQHEHTALVFPT